MKSSKILEIIASVHHNMELALWAVLAAFVIYFGVFIVPKFPAIAARHQRIRAQEIAAENASLCKKFDRKTGTEKYNQCLLDVGAFRFKVEKRIYDERDF
jgi:hypothetical protein